MLTLRRTIAARRHAFARRARLAQGVRGELPPEDAPLPLLQAYLESRLEKRIPPLLTPL